MIPYLIVVLFPLFVGRLYEQQLSLKGIDANTKQATKMRLRYIFWAALPMFLLLGLRNQRIGADTGTYLQHFESFSKISWDSIFTTNTRMEKGYLVFIKIVSIFTKDPLVYQMVCASIYLLALVCFIHQLEEQHFFVEFLFGTLGVYAFMFTGIRQCLATSICLFSFYFIKKRKLLLFALMMYLAFQFHKSSILFAVSYVFYAAKLSTNSLLLYIPVMLFSVVYLDKIQGFLNDQLDYNYGVESGAGGFVSISIVLLMTFFTLKMVMNTDLQNQYSQGLINVGLLATGLWILRIFTRVAERPSYYFLLFNIAGFAYAFNGIKNKKQRDYFRVFVVICSLLLFAYRLTQTNSNFIPYEIFSYNS